MLLRLPCLSVVQSTVAHRLVRAARRERRLPEWDVPQSPSHGSDPHPASTLGSESAFHWAAPPVLGAVRRRNTSASSSPSRRNADDEHSGSWRCSKHGQCVSALQKPDATNVAGLRAWNSLGRFVKRGEKGI